MKKSELEIIFSMLKDTEISFNEFFKDVVDAGIVVDDDEKIILLQNIDSNPESVLVKAHEFVNEMSQLFLLYRFKPRNKNDDPKVVYSVSSGVTNRDALTILEEAKYRVLSRWYDLDHDDD